MEGEFRAEGFNNTLASIAAMDDNVHAELTSMAAIKYFELSKNRGLYRNRASACMGLIDLATTPSGEPE